MKDVAGETDLAQSEGVKQSQGEDPYNALRSDVGENRARKTTCARGLPPQLLYERICKQNKVNPNAKQRPIDAKEV